MRSARTCRVPRGHRPRSGPAKTATATCAGAAGLQCSAQPQTLPWTGHDTQRAAASSARCDIPGHTCGVIQDKRHLNSRVREWRCHRAGAHLGIDDGGRGHDDDGGVADGVAELQEEAVEGVEDDLAQVHVVLEHHVQRRLRLRVVRRQHVLLHRARVCDALLALTGGDLGRPCARVSARRRLTPTYSGRTVDSIRSSDTQESARRARRDAVWTHARAAPAAHRVAM